MAKPAWWDKSCGEIPHGMINKSCGETPHGGMEVAANQRGSPASREIAPYNFIVHLAGPYHLGQTSEDGQ